MWNRDTLHHLSPAEALLVLKLHQNKSEKMSSTWRHRYFLRKPKRENVEGGLVGETCAARIVCSTNRTGAIVQKSSHFYTTCFFFAPVFFLLKVVFVLELVFCPRRTNRIQGSATRDQENQSCLKILAPQPIMKNGRTRTRLHWGTRRWSRSSAGPNKSSTLVLKCDSHSYITGEGGVGYDTRIWDANIFFFFLISQWCMQHTWLVLNYRQKM